MSAVSERVVLQEAIVAAWAKEGHDMSKMFTVAGIAADVALATRDARIARLEAALREVSRTASAHHDHEDGAVLLHALLVEVPELARAALDVKS